MTVHDGEQWSDIKEEANQEPNMYGVGESHVSKTAKCGAPGRFFETENKFSLTVSGANGRDRNRLECLLCSTGTPLPLVYRNHEVTGNFRIWSLKNKDLY